MGTCSESPNIAASYISKVLLPAAKAPQLSVSIAEGKQAWALYRKWLRLSGKKAANSLVGWTTATARESSTGYEASDWSVHMDR